MSALSAARRSVGSALLAVALVGGCSASVRTGSSEWTPALTAWGPCSVADAPPDAAVECATIAVPYDYNDPRGPTFTIPVSRIPSKATNPQLLLMNPGGPGISGVDDLRSGRDYYEKFSDTYTVVSFDPRGVGASLPAASCLDDQQKAAVFNQPSVPTSDTDVQRRQRLAVGIGAECESQFSAALSNLGTENVVRDMDAIRAAMGFDKVSYLGYSYGTFVGALYAQAFPERITRMVLDSVMDPKLDYRQVRRDQAEGMQSSVAAFAEDCLRRTDCPLPGPASTAVSSIIELVVRLDRQPFIDVGGRELSGSRMLALVESSQYQPVSGWPRLREVLRQAMTGAWPAVVEAAYAPDLMVNPADSEYLAVVCIDFATERDPQAPAQLAAEWSRESPISGGNRAWSLAPCESWPVPAVRKPGPVNPRGTGPVLILSTTGDPATPLKWAQSVHEQIRGSFLVIAPGPGHLASTQNACAEAALVAFLQSRAVPAIKSYTCPPNQ